MSSLQIRSRTLVTLSAVLGVVIGATGWYLAGRFEQDQEAALKAADTARLRLAGTLLEQNIQAAEARLKELAGLPLLAEYFHFQKRDPEGMDARELGSYLKDVFETTAQEPAIAAVAAFSANGEELLASENIGPVKPDLADTASIQILSAEDNSQGFWLREDVPSMDDPAKAEGTLLAKLPDDLLAQLSANGIRIADAPAKADVNILKRLEIEPEAKTAQPHLGWFKVFAVVAGLSVFLIGLAGACRSRGQTQS